ncbi:MAG: hypothetical protein LBV02_00230 [Bacteroidales bacterium]|jgi:hypothetical protein|nr:hypothetical protein [Bacteroidales bacterium]
MNRWKKYKLLVFVLFLFILLPFQLISQEKKEGIWIVIDQSNVQKMAIDPQGNLYLISESSLFKYDLSGKLLYSYTNFQYGTIHSVTAINPMKIMLFFRETGKIVFLDERLASISTEFDLFSSNFYTISLASCSINNQIWLYDQNNATLEMRDFHFNPVNRITYNFPDFQPIQLTEIPGKNFLMTNPNQAIYLFDTFGTLIKTLPLRTNHPAQVIGNTIYYIGDHSIEKYNYVELRHETLEFPCENLAQILIYGKHIITLDQGGKVTVFLVED